MFVAIIGGFTLLGILQIPTMIKNKWWRDLTAYSVIYLLALGIALAFVLNWPVPSPIKALTVLVTGIFRILGYQIPN